MTILELIISLSILALIAYFTLPHLQRFTQQNQLQQLTTQYIGLLHEGYMEAILQNRPFILCGANQQHHCDGHWQKGAILMSHNTIFKQIPALPHGIKMTVRAFPRSDQLTFNPDGLLGTSNGSITLSMHHESRRITMSRTGHIQVSTP